MLPCYDPGPNTVMRERTPIVLSVMAAGILWLLGEGFLLAPPAMTPLTDSLPGWGPALLGGLFVFLALSIGLVTFAYSPFHRSSLMQSLVLGTLFLLTLLLLTDHLLYEGLLILGVASANLEHFKIRKNDALQQERRPILALILAGALTGFLLLINLPAEWNSHYLSIQASRFPLAMLFIIFSSLASIPIIRPKIKHAWRWARFLAIPWMGWILLLLPTQQLPHLLPPMALVLLLLLADSTPWDQFVLPKEDRVGKRLVWIEVLTLLAMAGLLAILLQFIDQSFESSRIAIVELLVRKWVLVIFTVITGLGVYGTAMIALTINGLMSPHAGELPTQNLWRQRITRYLHPFALTREGLQARLDAQTDQIDALTDQLDLEKYKRRQLALLTELSQQLEFQLDPPVASQLTVNTLASAIGNSFVRLYLNDPNRNSPSLFACAGWSKSIPAEGSGSPPFKGLLDRVTRLRKSQNVADLRLDPDFDKRNFEANKHPRSIIAVPLSQSGNVRGIITVESETLNAFSSGDLILVESMAAELARAWERSNNHRRLMELIQAGIALSTKVDPGASVNEIANIARLALGARFAYVIVVMDQQQDIVFKAGAGVAPRLLRTLDEAPEGDALFSITSHALQPFRVRDLRKYLPRSRIELDDNRLRSLLVIPIRLHNRSIGSILAFGKEDEAVFTENDESLASLLGSQAAATLESAWLQQELRTSIRTTRLLFELSYKIIQAEELSTAADHIAAAAHRLTRAESTGIVLFRPEGEILTRLEVDSMGTHRRIEHPMDAVEKVMQSGRVLYEPLDGLKTRACLPIQTPMRKYGALWLTLPDTQEERSASPADLQTLTNQAALALERAILLVESRDRAEALKNALNDLEAGYDLTLAGLISALDARDKETEGHSTRVSLLTAKLGAALGLDSQQLKALERGALLHDIGKIGVSDGILNKPGALDEQEWPQMRMHPAIGARIIEGIPFLNETLPIIRYHHERWNGSGYPEGLRGEEIPELARIFAVVDVFDALTSDRPYRQHVSNAEALAYLEGQAGILFDPRIVLEFCHLASGINTDFTTTDPQSCKKPSKS